MKGIFLKTAVLAISSLFIATAVNAKMADSSMHMWTCETNASSAMNDKDKKADEEMKKAKKGMGAFDYAYKHCRDCTKITCSMETKTQ